jgi:hypothetical protein
MICVTAGDKQGLRLWRGVEFMQQGYPLLLILDVEAPVVNFGVSDTDLPRPSFLRMGPVQLPYVKFSETLPWARRSMPHAACVSYMRRPY